MATRPRQALARRKQRVRTRIARANRGFIRLSVHKSARHIYVQAIDDAQSRTIVSASSLEADFRVNMKGSDLVAARQVGTRLVKRLQKHNITQVIFDRGGHPYKGRVRELAEAVREGGVAC